MPELLVAGEISDGFDKENSDGEIFFDLLGGDGVYWYMFAMAAFMGLCYLLRKQQTLGGAYGGYGDGACGRV